MDRDVIAPRQQRSRDTHARLLAATIETLDQYGLEGATIPRIARAAGVAPASIYRRFQDRDALYRAAVLLALEVSDSAARRTLQLEPGGEQTMRNMIRRVATVTVQQYRARPGLMRAVTRFVEQHADESFRADALALVSANFERIVAALLHFRSEIAHAEPRRAITFGLLTMATIIEVRALEQVSLWHELLPLSDQQLIEAVTAQFLAYLTGPETHGRGVRRRDPKRTR